MVQEGSRNMQAKVQEVRNMKQMYRKVRNVQENENARKGTYVKVRNMENN